METPKLETLPPPPSVIGSIKEGFDAISTHLGAILLPIALDVFLWLGPHLSIEKLMLPVTEAYSKIAGLNQVSPEASSNFASSITEYVSQFNLFSFISTFPIGISSLLLGIQPANNPLGKPGILQVSSTESMLGLGLLLTLLGWLGGGIYFRWVASLAMPQGRHIRLSAVGQSFTLSILYTLVILIVGMPVMFLFVLLYTISPLISQALLLLVGFMAMWLVVPLFFSGHGIFIYSQDMFSSIASGIRMARFTLPFSGTFVLCVLVINMGMDFLWSLPKADSWMLLVGIFGHAFITTAMLAASFIYYRDATTWLHTVIERMKPGARPFARN